MITHFLDLAFHNVWCFWGAVILLTIALGIVSVVMSTVDYAIKCFCRTLNIRKHGWPPAHCDADGEIVGKGERE